MKAPDILERSPQWPKVRAQHLLLEPNCVVCGGDKDLEVHHVVPFHIDPARELDLTNLVTLCEAPARECHFIFGHLWNWMQQNPSVRSDGALMTAQRTGAKG